MNSGTNKTVIVVTGPTASGKTGLSIQLAKHFDAEIISADSRQCFREMNIGVARPSADELSQVPHHFIASHRIEEEVTAASFEAFALQKVKELFLSKNIVLMTGGTGLYIRAFCEGLDRIPEIDPSIRQQVINNYEEKGLDWLQEEIKEKDPAFYTTGEIQNPQRSMRALEVVLSTGQSILSFRTGSKTVRDFRIIKIGLDLPKEDLHRHIQQRVDQMIRAGLEEEVRSLLPFRHLNALQTVGYSELFDYLDGKISLEQAIEKIKTHTRQYAKRQLTWFKTHTRQYAKRQLTWFRRDKEINWFTPQQYPEIQHWLDQTMND